MTPGWASPPPRSWPRRAPWMLWLCAGLSGRFRVTAEGTGHVCGSCAQGHQGIEHCCSGGCASQEGVGSLFLVDRIPENVGSSLLTCILCMKDSLPSALGSVLVTAKLATMHTFPPLPHSIPPGWNFHFTASFFFPSFSFPNLHTSLL